MGCVEMINVETNTGLEYKHYSIGTEYSVSLASVWVLDDHHPTIGMPIGTHRPVKNKKKKKKKINYR